LSQGLDHLNYNMGLLSDPFVEDTANDVLVLPSTAVSSMLKNIELTDVPLVFMNMIAGRCIATKRCDMFAQLMAAMPSCHSLVIKTNVLPSASFI
jgi:hypothetical protein